MNLSPFRIDHDYHIHSGLSLCSRDPEHTPQRILQIAEKNGFSEICLTDHYWDERIPGASNWYQQQNTAHIMQAAPVPQSENVRFYFGCETDMDKYNTIGLSDQMIEQLDFIIIPTTHMHMEGFTIEAGASVDQRADAWVNRLWSVLNRDLPFEKIGIAHLTCSLIMRGDPLFHLDVLDKISDQTMTEVFTLAAKRKIGIELNFNINAYEGEHLDRELRVYRIAKQCGCLFYLGSDAHHPEQMEKGPERMKKIVDALHLTEDARFRIPKK